jgi:hypothetical protein
MKKIILFVFSLLIISANLQAQDLIVTNNGDSINCKITKKTKDYVHFVFKYNEEIRETLLPVDQIATQQKDYFPESELPAEYSHIDIFPRFRIAVDGGWQYRTAKLAKGLDATWKEHQKKLKSGFHFDVQAAYFFAENQGVELMFSKQSFGHNLGQGSLIDKNGNLIGSGELNEKITFNYIGANYVFRHFDSKKKNCWIFSAGLGYMGYSDRFLFDDVENMKMTAATLGTNLSIGYDIGLSENFAFGFKLALMGGTFTNYKQTINGVTTNETMSDKNAEGLGTIQLSVGLRFNK